MYKIVFISLLILLSVLNSFAQNNTINLHADSLNFEEVITILEQKTEYRFYYNPQWVDSLYFSFDENNAALEDILARICNPHKLSFAFVDNHKVVLAKNYKIKTNYAAAYSNYLRNKNIKQQDTTKYLLPKTATKNSTINDEYKLFTIGNPALNTQSETATLQGTIKDSETGEPLVGATIYIKELGKGTACNSFGFYSITVPKGQYKVEYRLIGMQTTQRNIIIHSDGKLNVEMKDKPASLKEVVVTAKREDMVRNLRMGVEKLTMKTLKQLPMGMGEADIIKSTLLLPGVQSVGEASSGFNVRGGSVDQNLILLNDASILNTSHFFGFFSGFNAEVVKDITLYKSGVPAKYGGRSSSVLDITLKDGNRKKTKLSGGISPVSGRLTLEVPIKKDKSSFIIGARTTYSNWILKLLDDPKLQNSTAGFYDVQGNFSFDINENNSLYLSGYTSHDNFDYFTEDAFEYNTYASTLRWKHIFSPKLFSTFSAIVSDYNYTTDSRADSSLFYSVNYRINQKTFKADFSYHTSKNHKIEFGLNSVWYSLAPGVRKPLGEMSQILPKEIENERALETALYTSDEFELNDFVSFSAGLRYTIYTNFGPKTEANYQPGVPRTTESIIDTTYYSNGEPVKTYSGLEFRFSTNIKITGNSSVKFGLSRMYQYIHMMSKTTAMSPTDIWKLSDNYLKPERGDQISIGFYKSFRRNTIEASVETYYKKLKNILDYKGGAQLVMNEHLETDVLNGVGKAYGVEFMVQKKTGKFTGFVNYTYSRILHKIDSEFDEERVSNGEYFPANYDKPHNFKFVLNVKPSRRFNLSTNFFYSTGRPFTAPAAYYQFNDALRVFYTKRNSVRMADYIRLDLAATLNGNLIKKKLNHSSLTFAVYNVLGRKNPYSIYFRTEGNQVKGYQMSIFAQPIFTITYNFKFLGNAKDDF